MNSTTSDPAISSLTARQIECLNLVEKGYSSKMIAHELGISSRTVDQHIGTALEALGVHSRLSAIALLHEHRIKARQDPQPTKSVSTQGSRGPFMLGNQSGPSEPAIVRSMSGVEPKSLLPFEPPAATKAKEPKNFGFLPQLGGHVNSAERMLRIRWIIRIALLALMATSVIVMSITVFYALAPSLG